jgi:hypothetical protein
MKKVASIYVPQTQTIRDVNQLQDIKKIIKENVRWVKLFS